MKPDQAKDPKRGKLCLGAWQEDRMLRVPVGKISCISKTGDGLGAVQGEGGARQPHLSIVPHRTDPAE